MSAPALQMLARRGVLPARSRLAARIRRTSTASAVSPPWHRPTSPALARVCRLLPQARAFGTTRPRRMADVDESFDPASIDRESDEVDVCIVGGGKSYTPSQPLLLRSALLRPALPC